jgi:peptidyl-prolyl cis-trans isomerase D
MLKQLRSMERTRNIVILGFIALMAVSLIFFFTPNRGATTLEPSKSAETLAKVGGEEITVADLAIQKENLMQRYSQFAGQISMAQLGLTNDHILDGLIQQRITAQEAVRLGLAASDVEVAEAIRKEFADASGKFDFDRYKDAVNNRYGGVERFESGQRDSISAQKLRTFVTASVTVSEEEVREDYVRKNTSFDLTYTIVSPDKIAEKLQPTEDELKAYYEKHKDGYRVDVPQKKIRYIFINQEKSGEKLAIADKDLHDEYDQLTPEHKQAGVKVQQIVLKVARQDLDAQVKAKADELVGKGRGTTETVTEEAFADLAKGNSEDPATAKNGGQVPGVVKKLPNKPDDPYQKALDMQSGTITDPIKYKNAYYILRRGDSVPKTFEDAKPELLVSLRNRRGYTAASKLAEKAQNRLKEIKDPQKVAQEIAAEANMTPADMVRETPFVKPGDDVPNIGNSQQFEDAIAPLNNPNDVGERTGIKDGFAVPMLVEKRDPRIPDYAEVKDKVTAAVKQERAKTQLEDKAKELLAGVKSPGDLKAAAEKLGLQAETEANYKLGASLGKTTADPALDEAIYSLKAGEMAKTPIKSGDNFVIIGATKRTEADLAEFAKQRDSLMESALSERKNQVFEDYLAVVQQRMESAGKIKIYQDVLARMEEDEAPAAAPPVPRPRRAPPVKTN